jgi:DNA (cytosine-5)-methyltransferase 1
MNACEIEVNQDASPRWKPVVLSKSQQQRHSVVSFFAGCGGLDLGFLGGFRYMGERLRAQPFDIVAAYDFNDRCVETYRLNIGDHAEVKDLAQTCSTSMPEADLLIGGFPCQDFSSCGPKRGLDSERGRLYETLVNYMRTHRPKVVVAENVPHLARMGGGAVIDTIVKDLEAVGYRFEVWNLFAPDYGVPQNRTRLFFVGVRDDIEGKPVKPAPTHAGCHRSIDWAIEDLETVTDDSVPNQSQYFKASKAKKGNGQGDETSRAGQPSYTVRANAKSRVQFHYRLPRRLTVRECARLQTFPDNFVFPFSATTNVMQIGNAVPPLLAHHVAKSVATFMRKIR